LVQTKCLICGNNALKISDDCHAYSCPECGKYLLYEETWVEIGLDKFRKDFVKRYLSENKMIDKDVIIGIQGNDDQKEDHLFDLQNIKNVRISEIESYCLMNK